MISFFRRALSSWLVLGLLALIMIAFVVTGVGTPSGLDNLAGGSSRIAKIGGASLSATETAQRVQAQLDGARQENPGLDMAAFARADGIEKVIDQMINGRAFEEFGRKNGMVISSRLVDGEIASIPAFRGPTGSFDRNTFLGVLAQRKLTEAVVREDFARDKMTNALILPAAGAARIPVGLVTPFASLLLEQRSGQIGYVPAAAAGAGAPPTDAELGTFYQRQKARYTVPETRVIRYALFDRKRFEGAITATEAEIAQAYQANAAQYAAKETRVFSQVVVPTQAAAAAIAAKTRGGAPLAAAAKASGGEATMLAAQDQTAYAGLTASPAIAKAAFAAPKGATLDPQKSPLGWLVIQVNAVNRTGGKTLADVRATLAAQVVKQKVDVAIADYVTSLEDQVADGATFDDVVKKEGLAVVTTPAITASGLAPDAAGFKAGPELEPILRDAFQAEINDDPSVMTIAAGQSYGFYDLDRINAAAPKPLASIRAQVVADFEQDRALRAAKRIADAIALKTNRGMPIAAAMSGAGVPLPGLKPIGARRIDLVKTQQKVPPALALLFTIPSHQAKVLEAEDKKGWYVVWLDKIVPGNAASEPGLIQVTQGELSRSLGDEYAQQFAAAIKADVGVKKNASAIAALKRSLTGAATSQ
jgi:peptidyl-prolyl cis-trans isomerase D